MAEPSLLQILSYCCFMLYIQYLSAVPGSVWFCVKIDRVYRMCIAKTKAKIFHCGLLNKDNSTWLSVLRFSGCSVCFCSDLITWTSLILSRLLQFSWPEAALPHNHFHNFFLFYTSFISTILLSPVHHSIFIIFS